MAVEPGWFYQWYADGWFPPVWFAPADESQIPAEDLRPAGAGQVTLKKRPRRAWVIPPQYNKPVKQQNEEAEALLLCGIV